MAPAAARVAAPRSAPARPSAAGRPRLRVLKAPPRRSALLPLGLLIGAIGIAAIIWIGLLQLRLTTKTGAVEAHRRDVQKSILDVRQRIDLQNGRVRDLALRNGMKDAEPGRTEWINP